MAHDIERGPGGAGQDIVTDQGFGAPSPAPASGGADAAPATGPNPGSGAGGLGPLVAGVISDLQGLFRNEARLAQAELKDEAATAAGGAATVAAGGIAGLVGVVFVMHGVAEALSRFMPRWFANMVVGFGLLAGAGSLGASGKEKLSSANLKPAQTLQTLRETGAWAKERLTAAAGQATGETAPGQPPAGQ